MSRDTCQNRHFPTRETLIEAAHAREPHLVLITFDHVHRTVDIPFNRSLVSRKPYRDDA
jgi:hypothetical protein